MSNIRKEDQLCLKVCEGPNMIFASFHCEVEPTRKRCINGDYLHFRLQRSLNEFKIQANNEVIIFMS